MEWIVLVQVSNIIVGGYGRERCRFIYQVRSGSGMLALMGIFLIEEVGCERMNAPPRGFFDSAD